MTQDTPRELLPCPFCGGDEISHGWSSPGYDGSMHTGNVECHACNAFILADTEAEAIAAWNTRTAAEDEIAELREALGSLIAACDRGRTVPKPGMGACGMTIEAQTRASCINGVDAWAVEEARAALTGDRT